ncbi:DUF1772 domain-containing protein [Streptomyces sp. NPDC088789]|uniref:anthrone oxygenase family protein n=1 Tax=Streptomyces sp. NPDC088789 TaxID=3365899 RepID=UPI0038271CD7
MDMDPATTKRQEPRRVQESRTTRLVLGTALCTTGLVAGVFGLFSYAVMPALARSDDRVYVEVMWNINDVIQTPLFLLLFLSPLPLTAIAAWRLRHPWPWTAFAAYVLTVVITVVFHVPLNDALAAAGNPAIDPARERDRFENTWAAWNTVRAVTSTVALGCLIPALTSARGRQACCARGACPW